MRNTVLLFGSLALTVLCWGLYGPALRAGQQGMSSEAGGAAILRPFVCVGLAYFVIAVVVPGLWLHFRGEEGDWTLRGIVRSAAAGGLGALGALAIILAFHFGGRPVYVMPLVFGGAPVVNAFITIYMAKRVREIGPFFLAGLVIVVLGAVVVLIAAPHAPSHAEQPGSLWRWAGQLLMIGLALFSWGAYGPVLHTGQAAMRHSRMRPLICVGLAYIVIAVVMPYFFLGEMGEASTYGSLGTLWSFLGGAFGAAGALGIILAFKSGGRPVFVMPLVFGGAPVVNTFASITMRGQWNQINPFFWAGLILVIAGSVIVLVLAPRGIQDTAVEYEKAAEAG
jgi:hypothetical protein